MGEEEKSTAAEVQQDECADYAVDVTTASSWYKNVSYDDAKIFIRTNLESAARSFIAIGYYLKLIRAGELYREEGHESIWDFAQAEYGISKSTASRYMSMNDRFALDGNSPIVDQKYKGFEKSKLQEMLSLTDEQLEQVTPEMKVQEIRAMRQPKEIPYFELEGQLDFETDFPEVFPETPAVTQPVTIQTTMTLEEMMGGEELVEPLEQNEEPEVVATSQQETPSVVLETAANKQESAAEKQRSGKCLHNPMHLCDLADEDKTTPGTGEDCTHSCCLDCPKHGNCRIECYASERREYQVEDEAEEEVTPEPIEFDRGTLKKMIQDAQGTLNQMRDYWIKNQPYIYAKYSMMVEAYENLLDMHDMGDRLADFLERMNDASDQKLEPVVQPELPVLKNNEQRAAFVDNYKSWPLWIETQETGERYYRYNLPDGTSFVVKTYHSMLYDYKAGIGMRRKEGYGANEQYILEPGRFFRDCSANRSAMIEKLKELQKGGK